MKNLKPFLAPAFLACALLAASGMAQAHVVLDEPAALAGTNYRASFRVGHGCDGSPTTAVTVYMPSGFSGAKPLPKPGWNIAIETGKLAKPYTSHGKQVTEDVTSITWTAGKGNALPDGWFDEFVLRGGLPAAAGPLWFRVLQVCEKGRMDWAEMPASGSSTKGMKSPAALLDIIESGPAAAGGHQH